MPQLREVIDLIASGFFSRGDSELFRPLLDSLLMHDPVPRARGFRLVPRLPASVVASAYADRDRWTRMSILNVARCGKFSSDRAMREYVNDIWRAAPVPVRLISQDDIAGNLLQ